MSSVSHIHQSPFYRLNDDGSIDNMPIAEFFSCDEPLNRKLFKATINAKHGDIIISTVFLGCDASHSKGRALFETMIFGGNMSNSMWRYDTLEKAEKGHADIVSAILSDLSISPDSEVVTHEHFHQWQRLH